MYSLSSLSLRSLLQYLLYYYLSHLFTCFCFGVPHAMHTLPETELVVTDPCQPSPCGPYSVCRSPDDRPSCSCLPGHLGAPPNCRPECVVSSDCDSNKACVGQKCIDPCPGHCGTNAECRVSSHTPVCSCLPGYMGNPFEECRPKPPQSKEAPTGSKGT